MARPAGRQPSEEAQEIDLRDAEGSHAEERSKQSGSAERSAKGGKADKGDPANSTAGKDAEKPSDVPAEGWKAILMRVKSEIKNDHLSLLAAGIAFKALLALFPALIAAITIWGLVASPEEISQQMEGFTDALPEEAAGIITDQMSQVAAGGTGALSLALIISLGIALWSASGGMAGLMEGCNAAYNEVDQRSFPIKRGMALALTVGAIVFLILAIGLIAVVPAVLGIIGLGGAAETAIRIAQWPLLALLVMVALAVVYKVAPDREQPQLRWVSWGAVIATVLWLIGSAVFTLYVENFGNFGETYGTFAGIIILMLWLLLTAFVVLLGAEINAELERQTGHDSTTGDPAPLGERGAVSADTTPEEYETPRK
jgi:membrane protein